MERTGLLSIFMLAVIIGTSCQQESPPGTYDKSCREYAQILKKEPGSGGKVEPQSELLASPKQFPFTALIGYGHSVLALWLCGGTLVSTKHVLSSAVCAEHPKAGRASTVLLGNLDIATDKDESSSRYQDILSLDTNEELAVFTIKTVRLTPYIGPACLGTLSLNSKERLFAPGWGANPGEPFLWSWVLQQGKAKMAEDKKACDDSSSKTKLVEDNFCINSDSGFNNMCQSDAGGGLLRMVQVDGMNMWLLVGVNSGSRYCSSSDGHKKTALLFFRLDEVKGRSLDRPGQLAWLRTIIEKA